jgi:hypothetical protein
VPADGDERHARATDRADVVVEAVRRELELP